MINGVSPDKVDHVFEHHQGLGYIPDEVIREGQSSTLGFLRERILGSMEVYRLVVQVIGSGEAGKTSMVRALEKEGVTEEIKKEDRTVGIDLTNLMLGDRIEVVFCDMAGQREYEVGHSSVTMRR